MTDDERDDLRTVMRTPSGQRALKRLISGADRDPFVSGQPDATAYNAGGRAFARRLIEDMRRADEELSFAIERAAWRDSHAR